MTDPEQPSSIGQYALIETLGRGATAEVWRARHVLLGSQHAVKVLSVASPEIAARLLREGRVQASLRHPNIVPVTDLLQDGGKIALVMELVRGGSLMDHLLLRKRFTAVEVLSILEPLLDALNHAHRAGVLHRDLKLANVLMDGDAPRIADFGLARTETSAPGMTRAGQAMGTPGYMPPEQWADPTTIDTRADLFALGVIAYELLAGRSPFTGPTPTDVLNATVAGRRKDLREVAPDCPEALVAAIDRVLLPDREGRFAGCKEMAAALGFTLPERELPELPEEDEPTPLPVLQPVLQPVQQPVRAPTRGNLLSHETLVAADLSIDEGPGVLGRAHTEEAAAIDPGGPPAPLPPTPRARRARWAAAVGGVLSGLLLATWWLSGRADIVVEPTEEAEVTAEADDAQGGSQDAAQDDVAAEKTCAGGADELLGYWYPGRRFRGTTGDIVTISVLSHVREDFPRPANSWVSDAPIRCALQPGQRVRLREPPRTSKNRQAWVPIYGGDLL